MCKQEVTGAGKPNIQDIRTTLDIYAECTTDKKQEVIDSSKGKNLKVCRLDIGCLKLKKNRR